MSATRSKPFTEYDEWGVAQTPCQRCDKIGGEVLHWYEGTLVGGMWVCPHCIRKTEADLEKLRDVLAAIASPLSPEDFGNGWAVGVARTALKETEE